MKKSELKRYILEALTPDEAAKVEPKYKETYAAMIKGKGPLHLKKYDNPDAVVRGRVVNNLKESTRRTNEKLDIAIKEVFSEKQRKYMCVMAQPGAKRPKSLSKADAKEMCADTNISKAKQEEQTLEEIDNLMNETGQEIAKINMDRYKEGNMEENRLTELVKAALMGPISEKKQRPDYPDIDGDGDTKEPMAKAAKDKEKSKTNEDKDWIQKAIKRPGALHRALGIPQDEDIPKSLIDKDIKKMDKKEDEEGKLDPKDLRFLRQLDLAKTLEKFNEDKVKGSNIKKVGNDWRVLSGKTGKMWKAKYDSKEDAEAALRGYFASQNESLAERILKELRG